MTQWGLDVLFNPGKRHMDEEKLRLQSTREEVGDASDGQRIDLASGKVTIRRAKPAEDATDDEQTTEDEPAADEPAEADEAAAAEEADEPAVAEANPAQD